MNKTLLKNTDSRIWYREPFVWLLILFPVSAVIMGIVIITLAVNTDDGLVVDDYYKKGLEINMTLERDRAAEYYEIDAEIYVDESGGSTTVRLSGNEMFNMPETIHARFIHRTRSGFDRELFLDRSYDGNYQSGMPDLARGNWDILIEANDWRKFLDYRVK